MQSSKYKLKRTERGRARRRDGVPPRCADAGGDGITSRLPRRAPRGQPELLAEEGAARRAGHVALEVARSYR